MKRNSITLVVGSLLLIVFVFLLFCYQVRVTEIAVVTTFGKASHPSFEPGLKFRWPWPIQSVYKFDKRIQSFEGKFEQTSTRDKRPLLVLLYVGWTVSDPELFFTSFRDGAVSAAEPALESLVRTKKHEIVGQHPFSDFVSTDTNKLKFLQIEKELKEAIAGAAKSNYGIDIRFVGIKQLALPESITQKVFDQMQSERQTEVLRLQGEGEAQAKNIRSAADRELNEALAKAEGEATRIRGEGVAEATKSFAILQQNPDLAIFLLKLTALEQTLKERSTLILDQKTPPFDLFLFTPLPSTNK